MSSLSGKSHQSTTENKYDHKLPMFGPLDIDDPKKFLMESKQLFCALSSAPHSHNLNLDNFEPLYDLGKGSFGRVILVRYKNIRKSYFAVKIVAKKELVAKKLVDNALREKHILQGMNHPFCIRLEHFTYDDINLYYFQTFITCGDLYNHLLEMRHFNENLAKFYTGQMVLALEYLHYCRLIHRDIKPENMILDHAGYIRLVDFGFAKELKNRMRAYTFCGTPSYIAPEVILGVPYSFAVDWWAVGVFSFEMVNGETPFHDEDQMEVYKKIVDRDYKIPVKFSVELRDLVTHLLQTDVTRRLGNMSRGVEEVKQHRWFREISWLSLLNRRVTAPYVPSLRGNFETGVFSHLKRTSVTLPKHNESHNNCDELFKEF